jgi:orotate phosphoribosyltransferase
MQTIHSDYNRYLFSGPADFAAMIDRAAAALALYAHTFDAIAFRGMSGALAAAPLALKLNKHLICVRKGESTHADYDVEGALGCRYIIVDDCISSGATVRTIQDKIHQSDPLSNCVAIYLYNAETYYARELFADWNCFVSYTQPEPKPEVAPTLPATPIPDFFAVF